MPPRYYHSINRLFLALSNDFSFSHHSIKLLRDKMDNRSPNRYSYVFSFDFFQIYIFIWGQYVALGCGHPPLEACARCRRLPGLRLRGWRGRLAVRQNARGSEGRRTARLGKNRSRSSERECGDGTPQKCWEGVPL